MRSEWVAKYRTRPDARQAAKEMGLIAVGGNGFWVVCTPLQAYRLVSSNRMYKVVIDARPHSVGKTS